MRVIAADTEPAGERAVDVVMHVDKARHDHAAVCVDPFRVRVLCPKRCRFADLLHIASLDRNRAVFIKFRAVPRQQSAVSDQDH